MIFDKTIQIWYCDAISAVQQAMNGYDPDIIGYCWDNSNPRIQLEPRGNRDILNCGP